MNPPRPHPLNVSTYMTNAGAMSSVSLSRSRGFHSRPIAFSWNTGRKVTGVVHNPHFYAWARENNTNARRVVGEVACGGIPGRGEMEYLS